MNICAVIPAAGQGTRLGLQIPKILLPIRDELNVWSILRDKLITNVNHIAAPLVHDVLAFNTTRHGRTARKGSLRCLDK
jgi:2-C-methyl-D-erythritol 4-phosphate cytidylyltransferase